MPESIPALEALTEQFARLPGIGRKSAMRMALYVLDYDENEINEFSEALQNAKKSIKKCKECFNLSENEICPICADKGRDHSVICVVEDTRDVISIEKSKVYNGVYHVLCGTISPIDGMTPDKLKIHELGQRIEKGGVNELIIATNPNAAGDSTAMYLIRFLRRFNIKITRIALGLPMGGELQHADEMTLSQAIEGRREV